MNKVLYVFFFILITISCSKKEEVKFEAFSPEAFAYDIGDSWEINATVNARGFVKKEVGDEQSASLGFSVDLTYPDGSEKIDMFIDSKEVTSKEIIDMQLEAQFELDYSSPEGLYKITFNVVDKNSGKVTSLQTEFELMK